MGIVRDLYDQLEDVLKETFQERRASPGAPDGTRLLSLQAGACIVVNQDADDAVSVEGQ